MKAASRVDSATIHFVGGKHQAALHARRFDFDDLDDRSRQLRFPPRPRIRSPKRIGHAWNKNTSAKSFASRSFDTFSEVISRR
jgi:hypothetical protein